MFANNDIVILLLIILVILLAVITISMSIRLSRLTKQYKMFMKGRDGQSMEKVLLEKFKEIDALQNLSDNHGYDIRGLKKKQDMTLTKYGLIKYDAFDDVGGKMSFALAMLNKDNTGFVLDAIHSRDNCFLYVKEIVKGESYVMLSEEELEAMKQAVSKEDYIVM